MEQMQQQFDIVKGSVVSFANELGVFLPKLIGAVIILVVGWLVAKLLQFVVVRGLKTIGFSVITDKAGLDGFLKKGGVKKNTIEVLGMLVYWLVVLVTLLATFNALGLTVVSQLFSRVTAYIPDLIAAVLILTIGLYFARFAADAITTYTRNVGMEDSMMIGRVTHYGISIFVVIIALGQAHIGEDVLSHIVRYVIGGVVLAMALAFGLGGQKWAADQLDKWKKAK